MALYASCPKCGADSAGQDSCPACGLIYAKYLKTVVAGAPVRTAGPEKEASRIAKLRQLLFYVPQETNAIAVYLRVAVLAGLALYGYHLAALDIANGEIGGSLMHYPILIIHEAGHVVFMMFGQFMHNLGGALFQITLPLILAGVALIRRRDPFTAAVCFWWSAIAVVDTAPYVYDAYKPQLMLLTGTTGDHGAHDFIDVLGDLGLLNKAQPIGRGVHAFGVVMLAAALAWGACMLWLQYGRRSRLR